MIKAVLAGYALGCVCSGYYIVRLVTSDDIRRWGSRATGATNVGRRLGPLGFAVTFLLDSAKGMVVVWGASHFGLGALETSTVMLAVVSGHIWPVQLGFRGGKGIATSLGAFALYDARIVLMIAGLFVVWFAFLRAFVISGLLGFLLAPLLLIPLGLSTTQLLTVAAVTGVILIAHREDILGALGACGSGLARKKNVP